MSEPAQVETGRLTAIPSVPVRMVITPEQTHEETVQAITDNLAKAGHPRDPEQVSAGAEAEAILAKIEGDNPGAEVVADLHHRVKRWGEDFAGDMAGSTRIYTVERKQTGYKEVFNRVRKMANLAGKAKQLVNYFPWRKKAA